MQEASPLGMGDPDDAYSARLAEMKHARFLANELKIQPGVVDLNAEVVAFPTDRAPDRHSLHHQHDLTHAACPSATPRADPRDRLDRVLASSPPPLPGEVQGTHPW